MTVEVVTNIVLIVARHVCYTGSKSGQKLENCYNNNNECIIKERDAAAGCVFASPSCVLCVAGRSSCS